MEEKLRKTEVELEEMSRKRKAEAQRVRELETQVKQLQSLIHDKDNEIKVRTLRGVTGARCQN